MSVALLMCGVAVAQQARVPRTPDGRPDLSGIWEAEGQTYFFDLAAGLKPEDVVMTPWAQAIQKRREERDHVDDPLAVSCERALKIVLPIFRSFEQPRRECAHTRDGVDWK